MSGIAGIFASGRIRLDPDGSITLMTECLKYLPQQQMSMYQYPHLLFGRVDLGVFSENIAPRETAEAIGFLWGELSNPSEERRQLLKEQSPCRERLDDLSFLLGLYAQHREHFPRFLSGSFNACIFDKRREVLFIANDRLGLRPLYYCSLENEIIFSSQVRAILKHPDVRRKVDLAGVADFFHFGFVTGDKTLYEGIRMLPPGTVLRFEKGNLQLKKYWELKFAVEPSHRTENDYAEQLAQAIRCSIESSTVGPFRIGLPLSGGLDSRTIAACIPKDKYPILVWTWGLPNSREVQTAKKVTQKLGLDHNSLHRTPEHFVQNFSQAVAMTDGMIPGNLPLANFLFKDVFMNRVDICLDGAQSIGAMYPYRRHGLSDDKTVMNLLIPSISETVLKGIFKDQFYGSLKELAYLSKQQLKASTFDQDPVNRYQHLEITQRQPRLEYMAYAVKRNFVEIRSPLFDQRVMDVVRIIPSRLRKHRYIYYKAFARLSPELAAIENIGTGVPVSYPYSLHLLGRIKKGLMLRLYESLEQQLNLRLGQNKVSDWGINYDGWYRESASVRRFTANALTAENIEASEYLNPQGIKRILDEQFAGVYDHASILNRILTHVVWSQNLQ